MSFALLRVGPHDLYEWRAGEDEGTYFGRATLSVVLCDKRDPEDPDAVGNAVFGVPEVAEFEKQFATILGDARRAWYWGWEN